jgi:cytidyltransferase-like protein
MNILNEGVSGHIKHLYENKELTFAKIKEIFTAAANGSLEGTEKVDGINLLVSFSVPQGKAVGARNKEDIKSGGRSPQELSDKYLEHDNKLLSSAFSDGLRSFERIIQGLDEQTQIEIFGPDANIYYNVDIISPAENSDGLNVINYDTRNLIVHDIGHSEYDKANGEKTLTDIKQKLEKLKTIIKDFQEILKHEKYGVEINAIKRLKGLTNKTPLNITINKINSLISSANISIKNDSLKLNDNSTINDFMVARIYILINSILSRMPTEIEKIGPIAKTNIAKKIFGIKGISVGDLRRNLNQDQFLFVKENILNNEKNILKTAIQPLEIIISDFTIEMLKNLNSTFILDDKKELARIKEKLKLAIQEIEKFGDQKDLTNLKRQIKKIKNLDSLSTAAEGFVFDYDGMTYKFTGNFAPVNQIMNLFKRIKKEKNEPLNEQELGKADIAIVAGSFKPPHKGHLEMIKKYADMANKVYIFISPLSRTLPISKKEVTFEDSKKIFDMYLKESGLDVKTEIFKSELNSPIQFSFEFIKNTDNNPKYAQPGQTIILGFSDKDNIKKITQEDADREAKEGVKVLVKPIHNYNSIDSSDMRLDIDKEKSKKVSKDYIPDVFGSDKTEVANKIINLLIKDKEENLKENNINIIIDSLINERINKRGSKYCLLSIKTNKNLGCFTSRKKAKKRERQVQYFKHLEEEFGMQSGSVQGGLGITKDLENKNE